MGIKRLTSWLRSRGAWKWHEGWPALPPVLQHYWLRLTVRQRGTLIVSIPIVCLFSSLATFAWLKPNMLEDEDWVQHTQQVRLETKKLLTALIDAENGMRGYGLTRREVFLVPYDRAIATIPDSLDRLEHLVQDNPSQTEKLLEIRALMDETLDIFHQKLTLQQQLHQINGRTEQMVPIELLYDWLDEGRATVNQTRLAIDQFAEEEERLLLARQHHRQHYRQVALVLLVCSVVVGTGGGVIAIYLFHRLADDLNAQQASLKQTNTQLQQACDQLQRFTANASHELRAPLAAVLSNAQVGLMAPADNAIVARSRLEKIVTHAKTMSNLVNELLFLARHEGALAHESLECIDGVKMLKAIAQDWSLQTQQSGHRWQTHLPDVAVWIRADLNLLRLAILNLLSNAQRYTPKGGTITLALTANGAWASIAVSDTGIGIPPQDLPHIFERFYRVDKTRSRKEGGFGLGLAIAQHIVYAHAGELEVDSEVGSGTEFRIKLPLANAG